MEAALQLQGMGLERLNQENAALLAGLDHPDPQVELTIANSLWYDPRCPDPPT